jgi:hypothetical protein
MAPAPLWDRRRRSPEQRAMINARADLNRLINGFQASQAIHVAATLGLADRLRDEPESAAEMAHMTGVHPDALYRLMRVLASIGVMQHVGGDRFALTAMGEFLRRDVLGTCGPMAEMIGRPNVWWAWGDLLHTVRTGDTAFDHMHGCNVWDYRSQHPEEASVFDRAMASGTERFAQAVLNVCDFGCFEHVIDVGGGDGVFLAKILERHPAVQGTLFDQPHVIARAAQPAQAFAGRYRTVGGNFFNGVPEGGDAYLLKWILHDWSDTASVDILRSCRQAMKRSGRLLVAEYVIGPGYTSPDGELMDLTMMVMNGGRERTRDEFSSIFAAAGFRLRSVTATATPLCMLEGIVDSK